MKSNECSRVTGTAETVKEIVNRALSPVEKVRRDGCLITPPVPPHVIDVEVNDLMSELVPHFTIVGKVRDILRRHMVVSSCSLDGLANEIVMSVKAELTKVE